MCEVFDAYVSLVSGSAGMTQVSFDNGVTLKEMGTQADILADLNQKDLSIYGKIYGGQAIYSREIPLPLTSKKLNVNLSLDYASFGGGFSINNGIKIGGSLGLGFDLSLNIAR